MDREEKEKMIFLFKSASNLLDSVEESKKNIDTLVNILEINNTKLNTSIGLLNNSTKNMNQKIQKEMEFQSSEIAKNIVNQVQSNFKKANEYAFEATEIYKNASNTIIYKVTSFSLLIFLLLSVITFFGYTWYLKDHIKSLENKHILLKNIITSVAKDRYLLVKSIDGKIYDFNGEKYIIAVDKKSVEIE